MKTKITKTVITDDQKLHEPCKYCGGKVTNLNNFEAEVKIAGLENYRGLDWCWNIWACEACEQELIGLSFSLCSHPQDDELLFDGCHQSEREQCVWVESANHKIFGHECFGVTHENPVSVPRFQKRYYRMFAQYTFGPYKTRNEILEAMEDILGEIIRLVRYPVKIQAQPVNYGASMNTPLRDQG